MSTRTPKTPSVPGRSRRDRLVEDTRHDPYRADQKFPDATKCPVCGAVYREGRWRWLEESQAAGESLCPACQRIEDQYPAGILELRGPFLAEHREEILNLLTNLEARERAEHPLKRLMEISPVGEAVLRVTTTDSHLARAMGEALQHAYQGALDYQYSEGENLIRASWQR